MRTSLADDSSIDEMPSLWRHTRQIKEKEKIMFSKDYVIKCSQCGCELEDEIWANHYTFEWDTENILCGEGECWADWMQNNTWSHQIEREEDEK